MLDTGTCTALQCLRDHRRVRATAVVETSILKKNRAEGSPKGVFPLSINIYGAKDDAKEVGDKLSRIAAYLQHPFFLEPGYEYSNPQYFHPGGQMKCMTHLVGLNGIDYRAKRISDEVELVFDSLDTMTRDTTDAVRDPQLHDIVTPLKRYGLFLPYILVPNSFNSHQRAALTFIQRRENHDACQSTNKNLRHFMKISSVNRKLRLYFCVI